MTSYVNYLLSDELPINDRGLAYGDGVFETLLVTFSEIQLLDLHLERLLRGSRKLGIPFSDVEQTRLRLFLDELVVFMSESAVLKVMLTRGQGGRGYMPPESPQVSVIITVSSAPDYHQQRLEGVAVGVSPIPISENPYLAGIKHLNRLENVLAKQHLGTDHFEDVLLTSSGDVIECIQSNLFFIKDGVLKTPALHRSGVQGSMRSLLLRQAGCPMEVGVYRLEDLIQADEVFIANSLMGIVPVIAFKGRTFSIGPITRKLQQNFS